jgi:hypothetical protein
MILLRKSMKIEVKETRFFMPLNGMILHIFKEIAERKYERK